MKTGSLILAGLAYLAASTVSAQEHWLQQEIRTNSVHQLAGRMKEVGLVADDEGKQLEGAAEVIAAMQAHVGALGVGGIGGLAPEFSDFEFLSGGNDLFEIMGRLNLCNAVLYMQHLEREQFDENARITAVLGLSALGLAVAYLGLEHVNTGGSLGDVMAFLTDSRMDPLVEAIQQNPETRAYVETQCTPAVVSLLQFR